MTTNKKIRILPFAKFQAVLMAPVGLLAGVLYAFGGAVYDISTTGSANLGTALAFFALVGMPILFAILGGLLGIIEAVMFNRLARWLGRAEMDFVEPA